MSANKNTKVYLALSILIVVAVSLLTFLVIRGFDNLKNAPSNLITQNELSQFYVNYEQSNTIAVVCPDSAKDNPAYAGKCNQGFYGYEGIKKALESSSKEHTVYLRNGTYVIAGEIPLISNVSGYLNIEGESQGGVKLVSNQDLRSVFEVDWDGGFTLRNITIIGPYDPNNQETLSTNAVSISYYPSVTIEQVSFEKFATAILVDSRSQSTNIISNFFKNNGIAVRTSFSDPLIIGNNIFVNNQRAIFLDYPDRDTEEIGRWFRSSKEEARGYSSYSTKRIYQNTFYSNDYAISTYFPDKTKIKNNIFSSNSFDLELLNGKNDSYHNFINDVGNNSEEEFLVYNFTDNSNNSLRVLFPNSDPVTTAMPGEKNVYLSPLPLVKSDSSAGSFTDNDPEFYYLNVRSSNNAKIANKGNPEWLDYDRDPSSPGAFGGSCEYFHRGCSYPLQGIKSTIPQPSANSDQNGDGVVDILDIVSIIKEVFGQ